MNELTEEFLKNLFLLIFAFEDKLDLIRIQLVLKDIGKQIFYISLSKFYVGFQNEICKKIITSFFTVKKCASHSS
jgi:hypothetical protein